MYRIRPLSAVGMDSSAATRAALIEAATPLFAAQGYEATRTREIADKAKANVSAINYHFGSKMGLYQAVIRQQSTEAHEKAPLRHQEPSSTPAERLRYMVRNMVGRVMGRHADARIKICLREFTEPTEALDFLVKEVVAPQYAQIREIVSAALGREVEARELDWFILSMLGQCYYPGLTAPMLSRLGLPLPESDADIEAFADHITRFSLAGFAAGA